MGGRREELGQERSQREMPEAELIDWKSEGYERSGCESQQRNDQEIREPALRQMNPIVSDQGERNRQEAERHEHGMRRDADHLVHGLPDEQMVERVVSDIRDERHAPNQKRAHITKLRPRLNHLRQDQLRALGRKEGP